MSTLRTETAVTLAPEDWTHYVQRHIQGVPRKDIAKAVGIHESSVHRWINAKGRPSAEKVIAFAHAVNRAPVEALIAARYLEESDLDKVVELTADPSGLSDQALVDEVAARLKRAALGDERKNWPGRGRFFGTLDRAVEDQDPGMGSGEDGEEPDELRG